MGLKSFVSGQTAFLVGNGSYGSERTYREPVTVLKVGHKYVTVQVNGNEVRFHVDASRPEYLCEVSRFGWGRRLFPTEQAASDWMERMKRKFL